MFASLLTGIFLVMVTSFFILPRTVVSSLTILAFPIVFGLASRWAFGRVYPKALVSSGFTTVESDAELAAFQRDI